MERLYCPFGGTSPVSRTRFAADAESRIIRGWASRYMEPIETSPPTLIQRGAFTRTLASRQRPVVVLWQHDQHDPIGRVLKLEDRPEGLWLEAVLDPIPQADRALAQIKTGTVGGFSIGFSPRSSETVDTLNLARYGASTATLAALAAEDVRKVRVLTDIDLAEVSTVTFPAQPTARILAAKELHADRMAKMREAEQFLVRMGKAPTSDLVQRLIEAGVQLSAEEAKRLYR